MEKLTIKELAPYLPYGLKVLSERGTVYELGLYYNMMGNGIEKRDLYSVLENGMKPLLRPLSSLTEEIEHNGESFVPIIELAKMFHIPGKYAVTHYGDIKDYGYVGIKVNCYVENSNSRYSEFSIHSDELILHNDYRIVQKLHEWHFDVFGLIDRGLALPIDGKEVEGNG